MRLPKLLPTDPIWKVDDDPSNSSCQASPGNVSLDPTRNKIPSSRQDIQTDASAPILRQNLFGIFDVEMVLRVLACVNYRTKVVVAFSCTYRRFWSCGSVKCRRTCGECVPPPRLKPGSFLWLFAARLKSCPSRSPDAQVRLRRFAAGSRFPSASLRAGSPVSLRSRVGMTRLWRDAYR